MITLKIVLIGIITLVPKGGWENPEKIFVLLNKGGHDHASGFSDDRHQAMLWFGPENLAEASPHPPTSFILAERDCAKLPEIAFRAPRQAWLFDGFELTLDEGRSPRGEGARFEGVLCPGFGDPAIPLSAPCGEGSPWQKRHDIRWLLDIDDLYGKPLPLDPECLATPVGDSCQDALAARLILDSGLISTRTMSGQTASDSLTWVFGRSGGPVPRGGKPVTFAGSLQIEIEYEDKDAVTVYQRGLHSEGGAPLPALRLTSKTAGEPIVVTIENVPLSERLPVLQPCGSGENPPTELHHAVLLYELARKPPDMSQRRVPMGPVKVRGGGVGEHNPPKCEPPVKFAYPKE